MILMIYCRRSFLVGQWLASRLGSWSVAWGTGVAAALGRQANPATSGCWSKYSEYLSYLSFLENIFQHIRITHAVNGDVTFMLRLLAAWTRGTSWSSETLTWDLFCFVKIWSWLSYFSWMIIVYYFTLQWRRCIELWWRWWTDDGGCYIMMRCRQ